MKQEKKQMDVAPAIEVIKMENEGVIAASSGSLGDLIDGGSAFSTGRSGRGGRSYNSASGSDLESMIEDILTFEK